jgi:hypothetical protein
VEPSFSGGSNRERRFKCTNKRYTQHDQGIEVGGLKQPFRDLIEESDAILHHAFQLVYALGSQIPLPDGPSRWTALQIFFKILAREECTAISSTISDADMVASGAFPAMRLLVHFFANTHENEARLGLALCTHLVENPPQEFRWIKLLNQADKEGLVRVLSNAEANASEAIENVELFKKYKSDILAVRGCIAYGLLFHGLALRHGVNYGLHKNSGKKIGSPILCERHPEGTR